MKAVTLVEIPYRENALDTLQALLDEPCPILFDSGRPNTKQGRYDIFSCSPLYSLCYQQGIFKDSRRGEEVLASQDLLPRLNACLEQILLRPEQLPDKIQLPFYGGFAGYLSYDLGRCWESIPSTSCGDIDLPELQIAYYVWAGILDHESKKAYLSFLPDCPEDLRARIITTITSTDVTKNYELKFNIIKELKSNIDVDSYLSKVAKIQDYIQSGDCYQVNLSQRFSGQYQGHPWVAYQECRKRMASSFGGFLQIDNGNLSDVTAILCFSPERFLQLRNGQILTQPIKGTAKRDLTDAINDNLAAQQLLASEKNRAENLMIVDLLRNDLGKCSQYGSVKTEKLFDLQSVSNVHHLVSSISASLAPGKTAFDLLKATFPGGSITGAPKIRSMEIIEELEPARRSIYCGSLAYIDVTGNMDSNIAIRTALCRQGDIYCWGGGGIVADSSATEEYAESLVKIAPLLKAINGLKSN
jgi:para-aminobenzoate synthetase component 1